MDNTGEEIEIDLQLDVPEFSKTKMQEARGFLRKRFLRFMMGIIDKKANFHLYENINVSGELCGCDVECLELFVKNLNTPLGIVPTAVLRATDVKSLDVNDLEIIK